MADENLRCIFFWFVMKICNEHPTTCIIERTSLLAGKFNFPNYSVITYYLHINYILITV